MEQRKTIFIIQVIAVLLHLKGSPVETMGTVSVLTGTDVTLSCLFGKLSKRVKLSTLTVEWNMVDKHSDKHIVYTFVDESAHVKCKGCLVDQMGLLQNNASLQLRNVTLGGEGVYTCRIITPVVYTETVKLEVLARPSVSLPEKAVVTAGEEKTLLCDVTDFYPEKLEVTWHIQRGSLTVPAGTNSSSHVCTEMAVLNPDGTYSIRSSITVHSSVVEGRETQILILCQIKHTTYRELYRKGVMLTVQASREPHYNAVTLIAVTSVISLLMVLSVIGGTQLICTGPPCVSDIITPSIIYTKVPIELKCTIRRVRLRELKVKWYQVAANADFILVPNNQSESDPVLVIEDLSDQAILQSESRHDHVSILTVCLTVSDDQTTYRCVVKHRAKNITRETTVNTKVAPEFLHISSIPQIPKVERLLVLCTRVEKFYPEDIRLEWSRNDGEHVCTVTNFGPFSDHEGLYSVWSKIQMVMAREDEMAVYSCRVYHSSFPEPGYKDSWNHINTHGTPPNVMFVNCEPSCPLLGEECTLNLCIKDFCPEDVSITWSKNGEILTSAFNTPPSLNINGLYTMWSFLKLTPNREDQGSQFSCKVVHSAQKEAEERTFTLTHLDMITAGLG